MLRSRQKQGPCQPQFMSGFGGRGTTSAIWGGEFWDDTQGSEAFTLYLWPEAAAYPHFTYLDMGSPVVYPTSFKAAQHPKGA